MVLCPNNLALAQRALYPAVQSLGSNFWSRMASFKDNYPQQLIDIKYFNLMDTILLHEVSCFRTNIHVCETTNGYCS